MARTAPPPGELDRISGDVRTDAVWFWRAFDGAEDLADLTDAARRLLVVGAVLFLRDGAIATSVRDIAKAGGVTPGALYNHFDSKEQLLYTVVRHGHTRLLRRLDRDVRADDPPSERLRAFVTAWVVGHLEWQQLAQLVRREYIHLTGARLAAIVRQRRAVRDRLVAILRDGVADGSFVMLDDDRGQDARDDRAGRDDDRGHDGHDDVVPLALMILDLCLSTTDWYDPRKGQDVDHLAQRYVTATFRLVGAPTPTTRDRRS